MEEKKENVQDNDKCDEPIHELWLIYSQLKDAETDLTNRQELISGARARLGCALNALNRFQLEPKSPRTQADNLNCRRRQKGLTPDTVGYLLSFFSSNEAKTKLI
jgi:hypothetical protein